MASGRKSAGLVGGSPDDAEDRIFRGVGHGSAGIVPHPFYLLFIFLFAAPCPLTHRIVICTDGPCHSITLLNPPPLSPRVVIYHAALLSRPRSRYILE